MSRFRLQNPIENTAGLNGATVAIAMVDVRLLCLMNRYSREMKDRHDYFILGHVAI